MKREVELARKLLESKGYKVSKKMDEAGGHAWMVNHPGYDPIGAPARPREDDLPFDVPTMTPDELKAQGAVQASEVKVGDTIQADFDASEIDLGEFYTVEEILDDGEGMGDLTFVCDNGQKLHFDKKDFVGFKVDSKDIPSMRKSRAKYDLKSYESKKIKEDKFVAYYMKNPRGYGARTEIKTFDNEKDADDFCNIQNKNGGYEAENGKKYTVDYDWIEESEEVLKPQNESEDLKYVCNTNGYSCYRKIENGKGVWFAKRQNDPDDKMFPISYDQARGFKEMPDETEIEKLQRELGDMLLPKNEGIFKKKPKAGDQMRDLARSAQKDVDDVKAQMEKFKKLNKTNESTDDRQQRRIVKNIADEVIRSKGENNSTGTYDNFIRKMVSNWATSGQDRDFIKSAIEKSFDKEFQKTNEGYNGKPLTDEVEVLNMIEVLYTQCDFMQNTIEDILLKNGADFDSGTYQNGLDSQQAFKDIIDAVSKRCDAQDSWDTSLTPEVMEIMKKFATSDKLESLRKDWDYADDHNAPDRQISIARKIDKARSNNHITDSKNPLQKAILESMRKMQESKTIYITKPDDLVGMPSPKFKVTYSTAKGETTSQYIEASDEGTAKAIIRGRCKRRGKTPEFISVEKVSESLGEGLDYDNMRYWNPVAIGSEVAKALGDVSEEELRDEIAKIINDEYDRGDIESSRERALQSAMRELTMERELTQKDPMNGNHYKIGGATPNVTEYGTDYDVHDGGYADDPEIAIIKWLKLSKNSPTMISIDTNKNAYAQELLQWVLDNEEKFRKLCQKYNCPYKIDYMIDGCKKKLERPSNFENKYNYPDQIYPFALG